MCFGHGLFILVLSSLLFSAYALAIQLSILNIACRFQGRGCELLREIDFQFKAFAD